MPTPTIPPPTPATVEEMIPVSGGPVNIPGLSQLPLGIGSGGKWDSRPYFLESFATIEDVSTVQVDTVDYAVANYVGFDLFQNTTPAAFVGTAQVAAEQAGKTLYFIKIWHAYIPLVAALGIEIAGIDLYRVLLIAEK